MNKKTLGVVVALIAILATVGVILVVNQSGNPRHSRTVNIAANLPLTGPVAAWSGDFPLGFRLGIEEASREFGVDPATFAMDFQDNAGKPAQAASIVQKQMLGDLDVYLVGSSEAAKAAVGAIDPLKIPNFIVAFDPFMAKEDPSRLRIMANSKIEAPLFIQYAKQRSAKSVMIIQLNSAYANDQFGKIVQPALQDAGVTVERELFEFNNQDYKNLAAKAASTKPDLIFIVGYSFHLRPLIRELRAHDLVRDGRVMGVTDVVDFLYDGTARDELQGMVFAAPLFDIPGAVAGADKWRARFKNRFGKEPSYVPAYAYDNAWAIVRAYAQTGKVTVESIRNALPFNGTTGTVELDEDGDIVATVAIARVNSEGRVEIVKVDQK